MYSGPYEYILHLHCQSVSITHFSGKWIFRNCVFFVWIVSYSTKWEKSYLKPRTVLHARTLICWSLKQNDQADQAAQIDAYTEIFKKIKCKYFEALF